MKIKAAAIRDVAVKMTSQAIHLVAVTRNNKQLSCKANKDTLTGYVALIEYCVRTKEH